MRAGQGRGFVMGHTTEYRGFAIVVPANDDGAWRWVAYSRNGRGPGSSGVAPRVIYNTRNEALQAAERAIDALLDKKKPAAALSVGAKKNEKAMKEGVELAGHPPRTILDVVRDFEELSPPVSDVPRRSRKKVHPRLKI
jgi:cobalamin biosynthesis protein CbiG